MKFSLINVQKKTGDIVEGHWIQNHVGTLETAKTAAQQTEAANSNRITVAVVAELPSPVPWLDYHTNLTAL
jgi:hypothetical protein